MKKFIYSVRYAFTGIKQFFFHERNARIQIVMAIMAIALSYVLSISVSQWIWVLVCIAMVISLEMINSAIEKFCDMVTTDFHPGIKVIKDVAAGAVLVASVFSLVVGLIIFIPALVNFLNLFK